MLLCASVLLSCYAMHRLDPLQQKEIVIRLEKIYENTELILKPQWEKPHFDGNSWMQCREIQEKLAKLIWDCKSEGSIIYTAIADKLNSLEDKFDVNGLSFKSVLYNLKKGTN